MQPVDIANAVTIKPANKLFTVDPFSETTRLAHACARRGPCRSLTTSLTRIGNRHGRTAARGWADIPPLMRRIPEVCAAITKKADVAEHPGVFDHVGLLINELPGTAGLPFI